MKKVLIIGMTLLLAVALTACGDPAKKEAKDAFKEQVSRIETQLKDRDSAVKEAQALLDEKAPCLFKTDRTNLKDAIDVANKLEFEKESMPSETEEIKAATKELEKIDFTTELKSLNDAKGNLEESIEGYKKLLAPEESFILSGLKNVEGMGKTAAVTEDNDPNGNLNKKGGYTAQVYFSYAAAQDGFMTGDVIEDGTDGGGSIEVYKTVKDAKNRDKYLAAFDGGPISSGSHTVFGSIIVRTSDNLTASQQKDLEARIVKALISQKNK